MICPKCEHTMNDGLIYCECCGNYLAEQQPKPRVVPVSTYRIDMFEQAATPCAPSSTMRKHSRSRKMRTMFTVSILAMFLMGFGGGMTAFASDDAENHMPLVAEYEEIFSPETETSTTAIEGTDIVTILDDPIPLAASAQNDTADADALLLSEPVDEASTLVDTESIAIEQHQAEAANAAPLTPGTLDINGTRVPYIRALFASACPDRNAALWAGDDSVADDSFGYFVGHNPGDFACVYALSEGDQVTLCNTTGDVRAYTVTRLFDIPNTVYFEELADTMLPQNESIVMQTCIGDGSYYRIVVCE